MGQAGQIIFLTDDKRNTCPLYSNSSKIKRVTRSTITAKALHLSKGCNEAIHINRLVSELLFHDGKHLNITVYADNRGLYNAAHTIKQTLEKRLLVDIPTIREIFERNKINITWIEKKTNK